MTSTATGRVELRPLVLPRLARMLDDVDASRRDLERVASRLASETRPEGGQSSNMLH